MTQSQFIKSYCSRSKITEKKLNELGQVAMPCDCGEEDCSGWAMVNKKDLLDFVKLYTK